jgi:dTDP-4-amino-4,6-dideoxygalactose transaminase
VVLPTSERPSLIALGAPIVGEAEKAALAEVIDSGWLSMGDKVRAFESAFATLHGADEAVAVHSCTAALQLVLAAFDIGQGDEVLVPSLSFVATASTVVHAGATPVFVDIDSPDVPHLSLDDARRRITSRTRAIVVMHYGGYMIDVAPWRRLADEHGLFLFEDAAHAAGAHGVGNTADAASFSFFSNKNMTTAEGGMVIVRDQERRQRVRLLRSHGMTAGTLDRDRGRAVGYDVIDFGHNYRMDELRAAVGLVQIERLDGWNKCRRDLTRRYRELMAERTPQVGVPFSAGHRTTAHILPVILPPSAERAAVMAWLRERGVQSSQHYPPIHLFSAYRRRWPDVALPATEEFGRLQLTLPLHPSLEPSDLLRVVVGLADAIAAN